ncbi:cupin domain-containing protein [Micromonosporaceae bacterium Da 78-11]
MDLVEVFRLADVVVEHGPAAADDVVAGSPTTGATTVTTLGGPGGIEVGVWEMSAGSVRDVEVDEVFLVLAGRATIAVDGAAPITVTTGDLVRLTAGTATVWQVTEPIRKLYIAAE